MNELYIKCLDIAQPELELVPHQGKLHQMTSTLGRGALAREERERWLRLVASSPQLFDIATM